MLSFPPAVRIWLALAPANLAHTPACPPQLFGASWASVE